MFTYMNLIDFDNCYTLCLSEESARWKWNRNGIPFLVCGDIWSWSERGICEWRISHLISNSSYVSYYCYQMQFYSLYSIIICLDYAIITFNRIWNLFITCWDIVSWSFLYKGLIEGVIYKRSYIYLLSFLSSIDQFPILFTNVYCICVQACSVSVWSTFIHCLLCIMMCKWCDVLIMIDFVILSYYFFLIF